MLVPFFLSYAEIHYHFRYLYPAYFKQQPEIIADCPRRTIENSLPVLIIIKDSNLYPVTLNSVYVKISSPDKEIVKKFQLKTDLEQIYFSKILNIDLSDFKSEQWLDVDVAFDVHCNGKNLKILNDNYTLAPKSFNVFYSKSGLPYPEGWYAGDPHVHTFYTSDQVEFGADLKSTQIMAKAMGLRWFFATDHSYDLDDLPEDYLKNDSELQKWNALWQEAERLDNEAVRVIPGEEISIGNIRGKNVHLLAVNNRQFVSGSGDSAERWFHNKPEHNILEVPKWQKDDNLFIAAHPAEKPPLAQKLTLRRGVWNGDNFEAAGIKFLQVINSATPSYLKKAIYLWKQLLLEGKKYLILAGNDAHGNFNNMRQIKLPFLTLFRSQSQTFGNYHTIFHWKTNDPVKGIKNGEIFVSNGIFLDLEIMGEQKSYKINSICRETEVEIKFRPVITSEFGTFAWLDLYIGDYYTKLEKRVKMNKSGLGITLPKKGYLRFHLVSTKGGNLFTNPVWIDS